MKIKDEDYCDYIESGKRCFLERGHKPFNGYNWHVPIAIEHHPATISCSCDWPGCRGQCHTNETCPCHP